MRCVRKLVNEGYAKSLCFAMFGSASLCFGRDIAMVVWKLLLFVMFGKSRGGEGGRKEEGGWEEERKTALGGGRREGGGGRRREKEDPTLTQLSGGSCPPQGNSR